MPDTNLLIAAVVGVLGTVAAMKLFDYLRRTDAKRQAAEIVSQGQREIDNRRKEAELELRQSAIEQQAAHEKELNKLRGELHDRERQLNKREDTLDQHADQLRAQTTMVERSQRKLAEKLEESERTQAEISQTLEKQRHALHQLSGLSKDEATRRLMTSLEDELAKELGTKIVQHERKLKETCESKAREMLTMAIQRFAAPHTAETTTSTVDIPNDDMKGRIIGREGRNIRAFEKASGVEVIIDDTPGVVIVSGFDMVRREVARLALNKLIADGRIHPTRIEEVVAETHQEMERHIQKLGEEAAQEVGITGLHEKVLHLLGRLRFRTSYSQNVLRHSIEVAFLTGAMAEEVGLNGTMGRRCGLLHDIGKAADHELEGGHPKIGADLLKRYGEKPEVVHAALGHHDDIRVDHPYTVLVAAADACSAARPGARRESLERYIKRMEELEGIATSFPGVDQAYAIQAGRELRVLASSKETDDAAAAKICRDIAKTFEEKLTYPGEIKVTVIRESRFVETAK